jgi:hypothetical protein
MEEKVWTQDVQPKDPRHIRLANQENAIYFAKNSITRGGNNIGSQFEVLEDSVTLQRVNGQLCFIAPLDFKNDYGVWNNTKVTPGYIIVSAEDDGTEPVLKILPENKKMRYTPHAFFNFNLERHLRMTGYMDVGLTDYSLEVDENGDPWWVITTYQPTIINTGEKITGVVIVNPATGESVFYPLGKIPEWVDRVMPKEMTRQYLDWWGKYRKGFMNIVPFLGAKDEVMQPEEPVLVYGSDNTLDWVVGMTSRNNADTALVALVYVNSKTGKSTYYKTNGGSTDEAMLDAVRENQYVKFKSLHPADPQTYNLYNTMASIMPLLNNSHGLQGVAIVDVTNIQKVAVGDDLYEALNKYQELMGSKVKVALEKTRDLKKIVGIVDRIHSEFQSSGTIYRIHIKEIPHLFIGGKNLSRKITVTEAGDKVSIEYPASGEEEMPIYNFDNLSLSLEGTSAQKEVTQRAVEKTDKQNEIKNSETTKERLNNLTPEQLKDIEKYIPKN